MMYNWPLNPIPQTSSILHKTDIDVSYFKEKAMVATTHIWRKL